MSQPKRLSLIKSGLLTLCVWFASTATPAPEDTKAQIIANMPKAAEMDLLYRVDELPPLAKTWLFQSLGTEKIAEYGRPWNRTDGMVPGLPFFQLQFALRSKSSGHTLIVYKGADINLRSRVWQKLLVLSDAYPEVACRYNLNAAITIADGLDYVFDPELLKTLDLGEAEREAFVSQCEVMQAEQ